MTERLETLRLAPPFPVLFNKRGEEGVSDLHGQILLARVRRASATFIQDRFGN